VAAHDLMTDESLLTGESTPVRKTATLYESAASRPGGEDLPYVYSGSLVVRGHGRAEVTATGARSEIGKIGVAIATLDTEPPRLQTETKRVVMRFAVLSLGLCAVAVLLYGFLRGGWLEAVLSGIALGMSMLPEEFPLVLTVFMVMGAWRISRAQVLTRRVSAIETLGAATVLCTDKTGTLTENQMKIVAVCTPGQSWRIESELHPSSYTIDLIRYGILASAREPLGVAPHVIEAVLNHVSGHKAGVAGVYNRATYDKEKRAAFVTWADHVMAVVEGRATNVMPLRT
jgi:Ca2+-transporting ATPase